MEGVDLDDGHFLNADLEAEREMERGGGGGGAVQQQLALTAAPFAFLKTVNDGSFQHVLVPRALRRVHEARATRRAEPPRKMRNKQKKATAASA